MGRPRKSLIRDTPLPPKAERVRQPLPTKGPELIDEQLFCSIETLNSLREQVQVFKKAGLFPDKTEEQCLVIILKGRELRLPPLRALQGIYPTNEGSLAMQADLMRELIFRSGVGTLEPIQLNDEGAILRGIRYGVKGRPDTTQDFSFMRADAQRLGLLGREYWQNYFHQCALARVTSEAARTLFNDVLSGMVYVPEELSATPKGPAAASSTAPPAPGTPTVPVEPLAPGTPALPLAQAASVVPGAPQAQPEASSPGDQPPEGRPYTHSFVVENAHGGVSVRQTSGITKLQLVTIKELTTATGGFPAWQEAQKQARLYLGGLGLRDLKYLTEDEGHALIVDLQSVPAPAMPIQVAAQEVSVAIGSPVNVVDLAIHDMGLVEQAEDIRRFVLQSHGKTDFSQFSDKQLLVAAGEIRQLAQDPEVMAMMLSRAQAVV